MDTQAQQHHQQQRQVLVEVADTIRTEIHIHISHIERITSTTHPVTITIDLIQDTLHVLLLTVSQHGSLQDITNIIEKELHYN
jgi:hypothetical protein